MDLDGWRRRLGRVGLWCGALDSVPAAGLADLAADVDEQGWGSLWFGESYGREALTSAALLLGGTRRLVVGTGIANLYARDPMAAGAAGRTLHAVSGGRFVLGLGISHRPLVERDRKHVYAAPLETTRAYLDGLDAAASTAAGEQEQPPRVLAALGPRMLELARDRAHGAHPYLVTPEHTAGARDLLGRGPLLVVEQAVALVGDADEGRRRAHDHLNHYTGLPNYRNSWKRQGFGDEDFVRGGSDRLKQAMVVAGDEDAVRGVVRRHLDAGADSVLLQVLGTTPSEVPLQDWRRLAPAVLDAA